MKHIAQAENTEEQQEERTRAEKWKEIKEARKKSLFWARRLSYKSADYHPEWKEKYEEAKKHVEEVKAKYEETEPEEQAAAPEQKAEEQTTEETLKININYSKISNGWTIEYFLKKHGFKKTAEALWVQCYYNEEKGVEVNTFFEERKPETPETEWKAEVLEAIGEQQTEEQPTEEQTADNQTTEQAEDTAEHQEEQASKPTDKPKAYREIIDMIIQASDTDAEVSEICAEIDRAYQHEKIKLKEYNQLYALIKKFSERGV